MNKLVYLEELDSVRNQPEEIKRGQQALYEEIVINGNKVVLTFNQVLDSRAFLSAIENEQQYEHIITLCRKGYLRFSSFVQPQTDGSGILIGSASQYIQSAIKKALENTGNTTYIFSVLPITRNEQDLLRLLYDAIQYSNPAILEHYANYKKDKERMDYLQRYVKTVLQMSVEKLANNPAKEKSGRKLVEFIALIENFPVETNWSDQPALQTQFKNAVLFLQALPKEIRTSNNRSNWHTALRVSKEMDALMAEAIVNVAYNYTVEDSIHNVSKHYDDTDDNDFYQDFAYRFSKY